MFIAAWINSSVRPLLGLLPSDRLTTVDVDFARSAASDLTVIALLVERQDLVIQPGRGTAAEQSVSDHSATTSIAGTFTWAGRVTHRRSIMSRVPDRAADGAPLAKFPEWVNVMPEPDLAKLAKRSNAALKKQTGGRLVAAPAAAGREGRGDLRARRGTRAPSRAAGTRTA